MKRFQIALDAPFKKNEITMLLKGDTKYISFTQLVEATGLKASGYEEWLDEDDFQNNCGWRDVRKVVKVSAFCSLTHEQLGWDEANTERARRMLIDPRRISDIKVHSTDKDFKKQDSDSVVEVISKPKKRSSPERVKGQEPPRKSLSRSISPEVGRVEPIGGQGDLPVFDVQDFKNNLVGHLEKSLAEYCETLRTYVRLNFEDEKKKFLEQVEKEERGKIAAEIRRVEEQKAEEIRKKKEQQRFVLQTAADKVGQSMFRGLFN